MLTSLFCLLLFIPAKYTSRDKFSSDIVCKKGKLSRKINVLEGDSYEFRTQAGATYAPRTNCQVTYKKAASCPKLRFYCTDFNVNNKNKNCRGKDYMKIQIPRTKRIYCGEKGPNMITSDTYLKVYFISDKRKQSSGAVCRVDCGTDAAMFLDFYTRYKKSYSSRKEKQQRFKIWQRRTNIMKEHNKQFLVGKKTYRKGENAMFDMTIEEIEADYMGLVLQPNTGITSNSYSSKDSRVDVDISQLPSSINWLEKGYVTSVQNQAGCGSSWAHSAAGALEGAYKNNTNRLVRINVDYLVNCATTNGCKGSHPGVAFMHVMTIGIVMDNEAYRSQASNRNLPKDSLHDTYGTPKHSLLKSVGFPNPSKEVNITDSSPVDQHVGRSQCLPESTNIVRIKRISSINHGREDELMKAVAEIGPVSVVICAPLDLVDYAGDGDDVFYEENCRGGCESHFRKVNHAVLVIGYGTQKNERTKKSESYWLVKNSWGAEWGNKGYIKMARNQKNNCGIASYATFPAVWGHLICGEDLVTLLAAVEGKLEIQCCGQENNITCTSDACREACGQEPIKCLEPVEEFTKVEECDIMNLRIAQVKISRSLCRLIVPCPSGSISGCSCCTKSYYYRRYKKCAKKCNNPRICSRSGTSGPVSHDESASDLICQDSLNETEVSQDVNVYFSNLTDADTSLKVLCCKNGRTTANTCTGSNCSTVCGGDLTCIKMVESMEYSGHCYEDVMLVARTEDSCKFAPCPAIAKFCKCCEFPSYHEKCADTCSSCPPSTFQAILISGGIRANPADLLATLELFVPSTGITKVCSDMTFDAGVRSHTMDIIDNKPVICGGVNNNPRTCKVFTGGKWEEYSKTEYIEGHSSWVTPNNDIYLMGYSANTKGTLIVPSGGGPSVKGFDLQDDAGDACAIDDDDSTILTGGTGNGASGKVVARYNLLGFVEYLPKLITGRHRHGCGSYRQIDGSLTLVVAAGAAGGGGTQSTETLVVLPGNIWTEAAQLPRVLQSVNYASLNNKFYILGGFSGQRTEILEFDGDKWTQVGDLTEVRSLGAAKAVYLEMIQFCK